MNPLLSVLQRLTAAPIIVVPPPVDPFLGYTRLSTLLPFMSAGQDLALSSGTKLLVDVQMTDAQRLGVLTNNAGASVRFDPTMDIRLLVAAVGNMGSWLSTDATNVRGTTFPKNIVIDYCGPMPTVSGNSGGGPLIRGKTYNGNTITGNNAGTNDNYGVSRGFINYAGGDLCMVGQTAPLARRLGASYSSGTTLTLDTPVTAKAGAQVLVTPSGYFNVSRRTEVRTLAADVTNSATITINTALGYARWGVLQYATDSGISLSPGTFSAMRAHVDQDPTIDQRAFVCIMDRSIKMRGYDAGNTDLATNGYGFHGMSMGLTSKTVLKNVEFENYGQLGLLGRYGWHFHIPSYDLATGANKTDGYLGTNSYAPGDALIDSCTFYKGFNRAHTWHSCVGVVVQDCIAYDSAGHSFFEEDGAEMGNSSIRNIAIAPRDPGNSYRLKAHDFQPAGHWIANFNNKHIDGWGVDCPGLGWWNAPSQGVVAQQPDKQHGCLAISANVPITPFYGKMDTWDGMSSLSCQQAGQTDQFPIDNEGNTGTSKIQTTTNGLAGADYGNPNQINTLLKNARLYKCNAGYTNRISSPTYENWKTVDIYGPHFSGATDAGSIQHPIGVRESLNNESSALSATPCNLMASYHGLLSLVDPSAYGFSGGTASAYSGVNNTYSLLLKNAVIESWDLYTDPIHLWSYYMTNWKMYGSAGVWQTPSPSLVNDTTLWNTYYGGAYSENTGSTGVNGVGQRHWQLGIMYDHYGYLTKGPSTAGVAQTFIVPNVPYYTTGLTTTALPDDAEAVYTSTPYFGMVVVGDDTHSGNLYNNSGSEACYFQRYDTSKAVISGAVLAMRGSYNVGDTDVDTGSPPVNAKMSQYFWGNHHGSCPKNGIVRYVHTDQAQPNQLRFQCKIYTVDPAINSNANAADSYILGCSWKGTVAPVLKAGRNNPVTAWTSVGSFAALVAASKFSYWRDTANNLLWMRIGRPDSGTIIDGNGNGFPPNSFFLLEVTN